MGKHQVLVRFSLRLVSSNLALMRKLKCWFGVFGEQAYLSLCQDSDEKTDGFPSCLCPECGARA